MANPATERQLDLLEAIRALTAERGFPPTLAELSARMGMQAPGGAASGVLALVAKELLQVEPRTARSMKLTELGMAALEVRHASHGRPFPLKANEI